MSIIVHNRTKLTIHEEFLHQLNKGIFLSIDSLNEMLLLLNNDVNNEIDVNILNNWGFSALMIACGSTHIELINKLIERHADIHYHNNNMSPLLRAVDYKFLETINILLAKGVDVNFKSENDNFALLLASKMGHTEVLRVLLLNNADVNIEYRQLENGISVNCIFFAYCNKRFESYRWLLKHGGYSKYLISINELNVI